MALTLRTSVRVSGSLFTGRPNEAFVKELRGGLIRITAVTEKEIKTELTQYSNTGRTRNSFQSEVRETSDSMVGETFSNLPSALVLDQGAQPHFPPYRIGTDLYQWVSRRGLIAAPGDTLEGAAYRVARSISRHGLTAKHYIDKVFRKVKDQATNILKDISLRFGRGL